MSNSDLKPININPALFNIKSKTPKNRTVKNKSTSHLKPNKLKTELITKIKNYRHNKSADKNLQYVASNPISDTIIENPIIEKKQKTLNNSKPEISFPLTFKKSSPKPNDIKPSLEDDDFTQSINFLRDLSCKNKNKNKNKNKASDETANIFPTTEVSLDQPHYGCLKNGSMPTYREWKNQTMKKSDDTSDNTSGRFSINDEPIENPQLKKSIIAPKKTTLKYYLGKRGKKVAVLIKNTATRKKINDEHLLLKQTNLSDMKNYLKRHNLLKSGSHAPPEIIKKLYEQALLGGDIRNANKNNIIHNYLSE